MQCDRIKLNSQINLNSDKLAEILGHCETIKRLIKLSINREEIKTLPIGKYIFVSNAKI